MHAYIYVRNVSMPMQATIAFVVGFTTNRANSAVEFFRKYSDNSYSKCFYDSLFSVQTVNYHFHFCRGNLNICLY